MVAGTRALRVEPAYSDVHARLRELTQDHKYVAWTLSIKWLPCLMHSRNPKY